MATIKSYTDLEQSRKLAEFLPLESADMCYRYYSGGMITGYGDCVLAKSFITGKNVIRENDLHCWSLAALLGVLPILERKGYQKAKPRLLYNVAINKWIVDSHVYTTDAYDNPIDACYEMIIKLHEQKIL